MRFRSVTLDGLTIDDRASLAGVAIYAGLEDTLRRASHRFWIPEAGAQLSWDRALFLNLTYWNEQEAADVLCDDHIPADVLAHVAWHELVTREIARRRSADGGPPSQSASVPALFFGESIASAFDLYLVGRLLAHAPDSDFVTTQVPLMSECAQEAGLPEARFSDLLEEVVHEPERAFEELRVLLFDAVCALFACPGVSEAQGTLEGFGDRRFAPLLHHYQLSNWVLHARAYAARPFAPDAIVTDLDETLRRAPVSLEWLERNWIEAAR
jgi:hypothetical protein